MRSFVARFPVLSFVALALSYQFAVVGFTWWRLDGGHDLDGDETAHMVFRLRAFGPLVIAVLLTMLLEGREGLRHLFGSFFNWKVGAQWYALAFSWKFVFTYVGVIALLLLGIRDWPGWGAGKGPTGLAHAAEAMVGNLPFIIGIALVEETAWMKYCVTRLQERYSAFLSCLLVGMCWGLWYLPMLLVGEGVPDGYPWPVFLLSMTCLTILLGWTYNMTHSGTVLLIMQIVSNCAFFLIPVLPAWHHGDATYVTSFVAVNFLSAITIVAVFGWRELGTRPRARWSDGLKRNAEEEESVSQPVTA